MEPQGLKKRHPSFDARKGRLFASVFDRVPPVGSHFSLILILRPGVAKPHPAAVWRAMKTVGRRLSAEDDRSARNATMPESVPNLGGVPHFVGERESRPLSVD